MYHKKYKVDISLHAINSFHKMLFKDISAKMTKFKEKLKPLKSVFYTCTYYSEILASVKSPLLDLQRKVFPK